MNEKTKQRGNDSLDTNIMLNRAKTQFSDRSKSFVTSFSTCPIKTTVVYDTYWQFAAERQKVFFARFHGQKQPWTSDKILQMHKFTNAYRAADRVSQYLISNVIYTGDFSSEDTFFRILLFKLFNKIETWELLESQFGIISYKDYSFDRYRKLLDEAMMLGSRVYSAAYIMPAAKSVYASRKKFETHLKLLEYMIEAELPARISDCRKMSQAFELLRGCPSFGDFLAYQFVTDLNYSELTSFSEMEFVVPGPGARSGITKCFSSLGGLNETEIIKYVAERQECEFERLGLKFQSLWGRPLQLIDCQNLFCETDKYSRVAHPEFVANGRTKIKQKFSVTNKPINYCFPPKWGLNVPEGGQHG